MKGFDISVDKPSGIESDIIRYRREYEWDYAVIAKVIRREYDIDISVYEVRRIGKKLGCG